VAVPLLRMDAAVFVRAVMRQLGCDGPTDLANRLSLGVNSPRRIKRWLDGENEPDYEATMLMLEAAGWLNMAADAQEAAASSPDHLEQIAGAVKAILANQAQILDRLPAASEQPARQRRAPPKS